MPGYWRSLKGALIGAVVLGSVAGLAIGTASAGPSNVTSGLPIVAPAAVVPAVQLEPAAAARDVNPRDTVRASASGGTLRDVALVADDGTQVPGHYGDEDRTWQADAPLAYDTGYGWRGSLVGANGHVTPLTGEFSTLKPGKLARPRLNIDDGQTVGVAAPIEIRFGATLTPEVKAAVERTLGVTTSVPVEGAWAWLKDDWSGSRVHWRPKEYWPSGTQVTVTAKLLGLNLGKIGYAPADLSSTFTIGRSQIVRADEDSHRLVVIRDGQQVMDVPASYGLESDPRRVTRSGTHIVMSKAEKVLMSNPDYGYVNMPEYWAVRISNNGEYIHANPASGWAQGKRNVSHGCINLSTANAKAYFQTALYGDPVEVTGSSVPLSAADGDVYDWVIPWDDWKTMSALVG